MATFNETGSGGMVICGISINFLNTCFNVGILKVHGHNQIMLTRNSIVNRTAAFIPNIVHCRQPNLRKRIVNNE